MNQATTKIRPRPTEEHSANLPRYELRLRVLKGSDFVLEVWQLPSSATPRLTAPEYVAGLKGRLSASSSQGCSNGCPGRRSI